MNLNSIKVLTFIFYGVILNPDSMKTNSTRKDSLTMSNVNSKEKVIIIGGGIAGLSAGVYALLAGFDAEIY